MSGIEGSRWLTLSVLAFRFFRSMSLLKTSGQTQKLVELRLDCDGDTLLVLVDQKGVACHTGRRNCFFRAPRAGKLETIAEVEIDPKKLYPG